MYIANHLTLAEALQIKFDHPKRFFISIFFISIFPPVEKIAKPDFCRLLDEIQVYYLYIHFPQDNPG